MPVVEQGTVVGRLSKENLIKKLRKIEHFDNDVVKLIDEIFQPVDSDFLEDLKKRLLEGEIQGVPLLNREGEVERVITPGFLETEKETGEYLEETRKRSVYEAMISDFPFPICLRKGSELVFTNEAYRCVEIEGWKELSFSEDEYCLLVYLPETVWDLFKSFKVLQDDEDSISLRKLMEEIEFSLLSEAKNNTELISEAARRVDLPRQTFNYRWEKMTDETEEKEGDV
ncbi:MAG: hypothetical protein ACQEP7_04090 [bacterium]